MIKDIHRSNNIFSRAYLGNVLEQSNLPETILHAVAAKLEDEDQDQDQDNYIDRVGGNVIDTLQFQPNLPDSVLLKIYSIFNKWSPKSLDSPAHELLSIIKQSPKFMGITPNAYDNHKGLAGFLLQQSFKGHLAWYFYRGKVHLVIDGHVIE
ncbi:hypothetical protein F4825DRAFT_188241 [Nemania diffusa]|nr:hypothetical protein F4825DRAFT_188241 [Nemania diffusa]